MSYMTRFEHQNSKEIIKDVVEKYMQELLPPSYLTLLLIISEKPMYGYEINKILENRGYRNWVDIRFSTIYKSLEKLEEMGLILGEKEEKSIKQSKKIFSITDNGGKILDRQIEMSIANPPRPKAMFDLGLSGLHLLTKSEALAVLDAYKKKLKDRLQFFKAILENFNNLPQLNKADPDYQIAGEPAKNLIKNPRLSIIVALFERPYYITSGELSWLEKFILQIKEEEMPFKDS